MTPQEASRSIRKRLLIATTFLMLILVFLLYLGESGGTFNVSIVHFFGSLFTIQGVVFVIVLYVITYFFASIAGAKVLEDKRQSLHVAVKYSIFTALIISVDALATTMFIHHNWNFIAAKTWFQVYFYDLFAKSAFAFFIVWLWATDKVGRLAHSKNKAVKELE